MTGSDIANSVKNAAVVLTTLSGAAYACGYLAVRARARALGADPGFVLIDQAYVFAGFRFVVVLLLSLLISVPLLLLLAWLGRRALRLAPARLAILEAATALAAAALTIWAYLATTRVSDVLLAPSSHWLAGAALGRNPYGALMGLATTAAGAALLLWTRAHYLRAGELDPLGAAPAAPDHPDQADAGMHFGGAAGRGTVSRDGFGPYGGNLDYNDNVEGTTLYFPVFHPGALLGMGDAHAAMGDGEVTGTGLEMPVDVTFTVDVIRGYATPQVRAETKDYLISFGVSVSVPESIHAAFVLQNDGRG